MARLPSPGGDDGQWGNILNDFLSLEHNPDGTHKTSASNSPKPSDTVTAETTYGKTPAAGGATSYSRGDHTHGTPPLPPDATATSKGIIQLAGDIGGTAAAPTVPGLANKADDASVVHLAGAETVTGVKTFENLYSKGNGYFDIEAYGASPTASPAVNTAAITAAYNDAKVKGGTVRAGPGTFDFEGLIHFAPNGKIGVDLVGAGAWATTFRATTADSQIKISTGGGATQGLYGGAFSGGFKVDGNDIAVAPLFIGLTTDRTFANIHVWKATGPGVTLDQTQNSTFIELFISYCGTGLLLDNGAANNSFIKIQLNDNGTNLKTIQTLPTSQVGTLHGNKWFGGIIEKTTGNHISWGAGSTGLFIGTTITAPRSPGTAPMVLVRDTTPDGQGWGTPSFVACEFQGLVEGGVPVSYALDTGVPTVTSFSAGCTFTNFDTAFVLSNNANVDLDTWRISNVLNKANAGELQRVRTHKDGNIVQFPSLTGTKLNLYDGGTNSKYLVGVEANRLAFTIPSVAARFSWTRGATNGTEIARLEVDGRFGLLTSDYGGASGAAMAMANVTTAPTANPASGGVLFVENGALKYRGSGGTVTTIAPA